MLVFILIIGLVTILLVVAVFAISIGGRSRRNDLVILQALSDSKRGLQLQGLISAAERKELVVVSSLKYLTDRKYVRARDGMKKSQRHWRSTTYHITAAGLEYLEQLK